MQVIEIDDILAAKASSLAKTENRSLSEFITVSLMETMERKARARSDDESIKRFAASYEKYPEKAADLAIWEDEQVWEGE